MTNAHDRAEQVKTEAALRKYQARKQYTDLSLIHI